MTRTRHDNNPKTLKNQFIETHPEKTPNFHLMSLKRPCLMKI